jgi:hypothetical protein
MTACHAVASPESAQITRTDELLAAILEERKERAIAGGAVSDARELYNVVAVSNSPLYGSAIGTPAIFRC